MRVRYTGTSVYSLRDGPTFDDQTREGDVPDDIGAYLTERDDFEAVGERGESDPEPDEPEEDAEGESEPDAEDGTCQYVLTSGDREGEPCGRDLPCPYHPGD